VEGETVVITAQASGQNEAINQQLSSIQIKNVVSMARIQELPDANAAESVGRLPGVSIIREGGEGSKVVIRGLSPQYNQITIDGVQLPGNVVSNDPNQQGSLVGDRATNLSMISSSMLGGIEVIKSITPDMDAAVLGGVVNFGLRKAFMSNGDSPAFELLTQSGYNNLKDSYGDYKFVGSYEQRFFDQSFGVFLQVSTEKRNLSANELGVSYQLTDKTHGDAGIPDINSVNLNDKSSSRNRDGATLVLDYEHKGGSIGMMNFVSSSDTKSIYRGESIINTANDIVFSATDAENKLNILSNLISIKQEIPYFHVDLKLSHTYSESRNPEDLTFTFWQNEAGLANIGDLTKLPPKQLFDLAKPNAATADMADIRTSKNFSQDRALTAAVDFQNDFVISNYLTGKIKFGGMFQYRKRSYDVNSGRGSQLYSGGGNVVTAIVKAFPSMITNGGRISFLNFINDSYSYGEFLGGDYQIAYPMDVNLMHDVLAVARTVSSLEGYQVDKHGSRIYDYHGSETKSAAYAMATFKIGDKITVLPGARFQDLTTDYFAYRGEQVPGGVQYTDTTVTKPNGYFLPMLHLRYEPLPWLQLHFAYTNTLNYPDYNAIIPRYDVAASSIAYNNYNLKPAESENFDFVVSFYSNEIGLLTFNGFKKTIKNLIFASQTYVTDLSPYPDLPQGKQQLFEFNTFINNPIPIDIYGLESDWQTHFWYLPEPFSGMVFNINYTHIFSEASYPRSEIQITYNDDGTFERTVLDTFYTTRMLNQPNDILNLSLGFDYAGFSGRLSMIYQDNIFKRPDFWMQNRVNSDTYVRWDLSMKQDLPWFGIQIFLNLNNLTGEDDIDINQKNKYTAYQERYGMTGDLGLRIKL
ncbi:MAG: TonB-dependent receptor, partial [Ignavibacteriae bacterium]|nr:TonB-dependent receptor [Ignavibacteriota bacterium]